MWGNIAARIGNVVERVKTAASEIESQLDLAVGLDEGGISISPAAQAPEGSTVYVGGEVVDSTGGAEGVDGSAAAAVSSSPRVMSSEKYEDVSLESPQPVEKHVTADSGKAVGKGKAGKARGPSPTPVVDAPLTTSSSSSSSAASTLATATTTAATATATATKATAELEKTLTALRASEARCTSLAEELGRVKKEHQQALATVQDAASKTTAKALKDQKEAMEKEQNMSLAKLKALVAQLEKDSSTYKAQAEAAKKSAAEADAASSLKLKQSADAATQAAQQLQQLEQLESQHRQALDAVHKNLAASQDNVSTLEKELQQVQRDTASALEAQARRSLIEEKEAAVYHDQGVQKANLEAQKEIDRLREQVAGLESQIAAGAAGGVVSGAAAGGAAPGKGKGKGSKPDNREKEKESLKLAEQQTRAAATAAAGVEAQLKASLSEALASSEKDKAEVSRLSCELEATKKRLVASEQLSTTAASKDREEAVRLAASAQEQQEQHQKHQKQQQQLLEQHQKQQHELQTQIDQLRQELAASQQDQEKSQKSQPSADDVEQARRSSEQASQASTELARLQEVVADRERALETSAVEMAKSHAQLETATRRLSELQAVLAEKDATLKELAVATIGESDARRQSEGYLQQIKSMNEKLAGYEAEGQALSKKQGEMEKTVRKRTEELKAKEKEIAKLAESKVQLAKVIEEQQELLRKNESDVTSTHKSLSAMQAVSQASTDKLAKLEAEVATKTDEISSQRRALESAWAEAAELKRGVAEMRAERDDLRRQIGEGTSRVLETESAVRDVATREAVLRATNKQLQDGLQRQMSESSAREERLRDEVADMRKRWQEAITSRETLASEMGSATAPLMRQIFSLQEALRTKSEGWQVAESSLSERALRAETALEVGDHKRSIVEEQLSATKQQLSITATRLQDALSAVQSSEAQCERLRRSESTAVEGYKDLEARLAFEAGQRQSAQTSLRELETRLKLGEDSAEREAAELLRGHEAEVRRLKADLATAQQQHQQLQQQQQQQQQQHQQQSPVSGAVGGGGQSGTTDNAGAGGGDVGLVGATKPALVLPELLPNGEISFAARQKVEQQLQKREGDLAALSLQCTQLATARDALLKEVTFLSSRNAQLEEEAASVPFLRDDAQNARRRCDLLLALLGEKEEELEAMEGDMREVKGLYRQQMDSLLDRVATMG